MVVWYPADTACCAKRVAQRAGRTHARTNARAHARIGILIMKHTHARTSARTHTVHDVCVCEPVCACGSACTRCSPERDLIPANARRFNSITAHRCECQLWAGKGEMWAVWSFVIRAGVGELRLLGGGGVCRQVGVAGESPQNGCRYEVGRWRAADNTAGALPALRQSDDGEY